jgi:hypothetical protein
VDVGDAIGGTADFQRLSIALQAFAQIGYDALTLQRGAA